MKPFLFSYFINNGEDGLHLATSDDGLKFRALANDKRFLAPQVGESKLMRDPFLLQAKDGTFHLIWTTAWEGKTIGYASSKNLIHWSDQRAIEVMDHENGVRNCWAPEMIYDDATEQFVIFWASTIIGRFPETAHTCESDYNHRIYFTTTKDFKSFAPTKLFYDPGFSVIDATFLRKGSELYLIIKDETKTPVKKHLRIAKAASPTGPFSELSKPFTPDWVEGPTAIQIGEWSYVYFDMYMAKKYGAMRSRDLKSWEDVSDQLVLPRASHGAILTVDAGIIACIEE